METLNDCPKCEGTGTQTWTLKETDAKGNWIDSTQSTIDCLWCNAIGKVDDETLEQITYEDSLWCECEDEQEAMLNAYYLEDGEHDELEKHHWRCGCCDKVLQIG